MLFERIPKLSREEILMIVGLPLRELRHSRAVQEILEEGRQEGHNEGRQEGREEGLEAGRQQEAAALAIRQLRRRFGSLDGVSGSGSPRYPCSSWNSWRKICSISRCLATFRPGSTTIRRAEPGPP
jgi:hypothetical protein